jgi:hypothetical protein
LGEPKKKKIDYSFTPNKVPKVNEKRTTSWRGMDVLNSPKCFGHLPYINFASPQWNETNPF